MRPNVVVSPEVERAAGTKERPNGWTWRVDDDLSDQEILLVPSEALRPELHARAISPDDASQRAERWFRDPSVDEYFARRALLDIINHFAGPIFDGDRRRNGDLLEQVKRLLQEGRLIAMREPRED